MQAAAWEEAAADASTVAIASVMTAMSFLQSALGHVLVALANAVAKTRAVACTNSPVWRSDWNSPTYHTHSPHAYINVTNIFNLSDQMTVGRAG